MSTQINFDPTTQSLVINTDENVKTYQPFNIFDDLNPLLNEIMPEFDFSNPPVDPIELAGRLKVTMKLYGGIGLAANQCGIRTRLFVIGNDNVIFTCFNPRIVSISEKSVLGNEGCLSFPGIFLNIQRNETIEVEYYDERGMLIRNTFSGITAKCFQHELDHLNGIKFTSYVGKTAIIMAKKRQEKFKRKHKKMKKTQKI